MASQGISFKDLTTLRVGGPVAHLERPESPEECIALVAELDRKNKPLLILGGGSNICAPDAGYAGTVVIPSFSSFLFEPAREQVRVTAEAGMVWDALVAETVARGLWGLENLSGIPGTVGAAPIQNIGAYGAQVSDRIEKVVAYDRREKRVRTLATRELDFEYRNSVLKKELERFVVLRVSFLLTRNGTPHRAYKDLAEYWNDAVPSLAGMREAVVSIRNDKFPDMAEYGTAGSFFLSPVLEQRHAARLVKEFPALPHFREGDSAKVSLAWLFDHVLEAKGLSVGGAFVWHRQPLVIATREQATAEDISALAQLLQEKMYETLGVHIVPEVNIVAL